MSYRIQYRRATAAIAAANNVVLAQGEPGLETDTGLTKVGDGVTPWNDLDYDPALAAVDNLDGSITVTTGRSASVIGADVAGAAAAAQAAAAINAGSQISAAVTAEHDTERAHQSATYLTPLATAPAGPVAGQPWLSKSLTKVQVDPSQAGRSYLGFVGIEPSVWYANGVFNMVYTGSMRLFYRSCAGDPTVAANWSAATPIIGQGNGGFTTTGWPAHSYVYIEGSTLYLYFVDTATQDTRVATADISAPTVWTTQTAIVLGTQGRGTDNGNVCVVKDGSVYRMFQECIHTDTFPGEGVSYTWQTVMATCSTPTGTFTTILDPVASLRCGPNASVSGLWIGQEGATWVAYFHAGAWGKSQPTDIYRATTTDLSTDSWVLTDRGFPIVKRVSKHETDQVADPFVCSSPGGVNYLFWEGVDNAAGATDTNNMMCAPLQPSLHMWGGAAWQSGNPTTSPEPYHKHLPYVIQNLAHLNKTGAATIGTWVIDPTVTGLYGGCRRYNSTSALNDEIQFDVTLEPGTYTFALVYIKDPAGAIISVDFSDGGLGWAIQSGNLLDTYSATVVPNQIYTHAFTIYGTETIRRRLRMKIATRNAANTAGYRLYDQGWTLTRTDI